jgi:hypothetical protein
LHLLSLGHDLGGELLFLSILVLLFADAAEGLLVLIAPALVAEGEVVGELEVLDLLVLLLLHIVSIEERLGTALDAVEAFLTLPPAVGDHLKLGLQAVGVESLVTDIAVQEQVLLDC